MDGYHSEYSWGGGGGGGEGGGSGLSLFHNVYVDDLIKELIEWIPYNAICANELQSAQINLS